MTAGTDAVLRDGSTVHVRPVEAADVADLETFLAGLSPESRLLRFFSGGIDVERTADVAAHPERDYGYALVATTGADERIIAHACYERESPTDEHAEVALAVADAHQARGLGTLLLGQLAEDADERGISVFDAHVLPQNIRMLRVMRDSGFPLRRRTVPGDVEISFPTALTPEARSAFERREQLAAAAALRRVLEPTSVAVIGASRQRGTPGGEVFHNLVTGGFAGPVHPVNTEADVVQSVAAYRSIADVPRPVDLAVIAVPARHVTTVARDCAKAGVRALVVLSAGFSEVGGQGADRQRELLDICRATGMRLVGPNCLGVANTDPAVRLNAQFGPAVPTPGRVGFLSQSGALGLAIIDYANTLELGLSSFVSVGNKADLSGNDLINYWEDDPRTDVILLYLESFGNPRKFARIARRVARSKPIVAVKSGRTRAGAKAASSHTGALLQASDRTVDALFHQAGVIRTDTLSELFDVATVFANQPVPAGHRVAIVTNAGGPGILCADACTGAGLQVVDLSTRTQDALRRFLPPEAAVSNPVDTVAAVSPDHFRQTVSVVGGSGEADALIVIYIPPLPGGEKAMVAAVRDGTDELRGSVPVLSVFMSSSMVHQVDGDAPIPTYEFPENAVRALAHAADYGAWRRTPDDPPAEPAGVDHDEASALLADVSGSAPDGRWLNPSEVARLFACYGIPLVSTRSVADVDEAVAAARELGPGVALKAISPDLVHKTDIGAVQLGLETDDEVATAAEQIADAVAAAGQRLDGYIVQPMVDQGVELLMGVTHDPVFGPVVVCGAGGTAVELVNDVAARITPLTERDAREMLESLATYPLLDGYRGAPRANIAAVRDLLVRIGSLAEHQPAIAELDCNPVIATTDRVAVVDARVLVSGAATNRRRGRRNRGAQAAETLPSM